MFKHTNLVSAYVRTYSNDGPSSCTYVCTYIHTFIQKVELYIHMYLHTYDQFSLLSNYVHKNLDNLTLSGATYTCQIMVVFMVCKNDCVSERG